MKKKMLSVAVRNRKKKAIAREYEAKRRELGLDTPPFRRGIGFYLAILLVMAMVGYIVYTKAGDVGRRKTVDTKKLFAQRSVDALAEALGRYRFHCGCYPAEEDGGLDALASKESRHPGWLGPYAGSWGAIIPDPWKHPYIYEPSEKGPPVLLSAGPDGVRGTPDDILPDESLFEKPFRDVSWTNNWVHFSKRGIMIMPRKNTKGDAGR